MLGGLTAIIISGCLNQLGKRYPHLTGEGQLMPNRANADATVSNLRSPAKRTDDHRLGRAAGGVAVHAGHARSQADWSASAGGHVVYGGAGEALQRRLSASAGGFPGGVQILPDLRDPPILFAVGVAITPWHELVAAFTVSNLLVIVSTVSRWWRPDSSLAIRYAPIDVAIVSCRQAGGWHR